MIEINGNLCHKAISNNLTPVLTFDKSKNFEEQKAAIGAKLRELMGLDLIEANACEPNLTIEEDIMMDGYRRIRFVFFSEPDTPVPCYLLIPDTGKKKYPVAITLQGHSTGFHNSIGVVKYDQDKSYQPRGAFGLQAVENGFIALCIEQRSMGERRPPNPADRGHNCCFQAHNAFMLGRTTIGERVHDISRAIDLLSNFEQCDLDKICITGNSGGGTASYYAACIDERIKISIPSCAFCPYDDSIMAMLHCGCNYIPSARRYFEMQDLACLIAPRKLAIVAGNLDPIFPIDGVKRGFETVKKIYASAGVSENASLTVTPREHWWCEDIVWPLIKEISNW